MATTPRLLPLLKRRDALALQQLRALQALDAARTELARVDEELLAAREENRALAARMLELEERRAGAGAGSSDAGAGASRWEVVRNVVQAVVVASGVDWVRDEALRGLVLECGE